MEKDGYLGNYLTENLGDIMAGQNITGSIMNRINDGMVPGDMASAKWLAWAKPKGVHTEEYMGSFAPKKPASLLDNLKSKFSILNKPKKYNTGGHVLGAGTATSDSIPAMLSDGEYVIRASSVKKYGTETFDALNAQRFSEGSPGGVKPIKARTVMKMNAKAGATWQIMEEFEKALSLKYGANQNASGFSKWSRALGRVAFNALQGGVSGVSGSPNPLGALVGTAYGLGEGITGLIKDGSQYGVKGGKYATPKGAKTRRFNPEKELKKINLKDSGLKVLEAAGYSAAFGLAFHKVGQLAQAANKKFKLTDKIPEPIKNKVGSISDSLKPKIEQLSQPFSNPFKSDKVTNLIGSAMIGLQRPFIGTSSGSVLPDFNVNRTRIVDEVNKTIGAYKVSKSRFGDSVHKEYVMENSKRPIVFKGHTEDLSNVESVGDVDIVSTSAIGILTKALEMKPGDKKLQTLLDNFTEAIHGSGLQTLGIEEKHFLDRMGASIGIDNDGTMLQKENTDGYAMFLASLTGDKEAKDLITFKQNRLYASLVENKQKIIDDRAKHAHLSTSDPVDLSTVPLIHSTPYPVTREADNSVKIFPAGHHNINDIDLATGLNHNYPRTTVHLGAESSVANIIERNASKTQTRIMGKGSDLVYRNGLPENFIPTDVYYVRDVGQSLDFDNPVILQDFINSSLYKDTLVKAGLLNAGQRPKPLTVDPDKNNIYLLKKPKYTKTDRKTIQKFIDDNPYLMVESRGDIGPRTPFQNIEGKEEEVLEKIAIQLAKKKLGINTPYVGQSGPESLNYLPRNNEYAAFAAKNHLGFEFHSGTPLSMAEKEVAGGFGSGNYITLGGTGWDTWSKAGQAYIEQVRMSMIHNASKTNIIKLDKMDKDDIDALGYITDKTKQVIQPIVEWRSPFPKGHPDYAEPVSKEQQKLNVLADIAKAAKKRKPGLALGGLINQQIKKPTYSIPSFATGIDYLPNDMIAQLHQGERVLTKEENKTYSSSAPTTNIININGSDLNKKEIAQAVMVELDRAKNKNNKTNMVGR
jgi:hypothetical protein